MRTSKQAAASRANGARSAGPVTPEGKQQASRNALKHGLSSRVVVLSCEDSDAYQRSVMEYYETWQPATQMERDLVNDIAASRWRLNRIVALETAAFDLELDRGREDFQKSFVRADEATRCVIAYESLSQSKTLANLHRHENRLRRTIEQATRQLIQLQQLRQKQAELASPETVQNEPARESGEQRPGTVPAEADRRLAPAMETSEQQNCENEPEPDPSAVLRGIHPDLVAALRYALNTIPDDAPLDSAA